MKMDSDVDRGIVANFENSFSKFATMPLSTSISKLFIFMRVKKIYKRSTFTLLFLPFLLSINWLYIVVIVFFSKGDAKMCMDFEERYFLCPRDQGSCRSTG
jgi:hypothetical protein